MASGVKITDEVKSVYAKVAISSKTPSPDKLKFAVFSFSDDLTKIIVEGKGKKGDENWEYDNLVATLPANDVRYIAYDFEYLKMEGSDTSKVVLVSWCPETSPIKKKMLGASSFNALKLALGSPDKYLEGDCLSEVDTKAVLEKLSGKESLNK
ncbi:cofilin [Elysia marginata]|uniref:Cofilin n=1 Tax=Elysia marginata TaxID=1093978 RepID=A0AAV4HJI7_9GAST|nr:cofilin [Elysia marginata]